MNPSAKKEIEDYLKTRRPTFWGFLKYSEKKLPQWHPKPLNPADFLKMWKQRYELVSNTKVTVTKAAQVLASNICSQYSGGHQNTLQQQPQNRQYYLRDRRAVVYKLGGTRKRPRQKPVPVANSFAEVIRVWAAHNIIIVDAGVDSNGVEAASLGPKPLEVNDQDFLLAVQKKLEGQDAAGAVYLAVNRVQKSTGFSDAIGWTALNILQAHQFNTNNPAEKQDESIFTERVVNPYVDTIFSTIPGLKKQGHFTRVAGTGIYKPDISYRISNQEETIHFDLLVWEIKTNKSNAGSDLQKLGLTMKQMRINNCSNQQDAAYNINSAVFGVICRGYACQVYKMKSSPNNQFVMTKFDEFDLKEFNMSTIQSVVNLKNLVLEQVETLSVL